MENGRLNLQSKLETFLGSNNVYFQPPTNLNMRYPAIVYKINNIDSKHADDKNYKLTDVFQVILIVYDPDDPRIHSIMETFDNCRFVTAYEKDGLRHYVYNIY